MNKKIRPKLYTLEHLRSLHCYKKVLKGERD